MSVTRDGSPRLLSVTCRSLFYASHGPRTASISRYNEGGQQAPRSVSGHASALSLKRPASSARLSCLPFFPVALPPFFFASEVNGFESRGVQARGGEGSRRARNDGGWRYRGQPRPCPPCKRCIVSLLHSFLILRSACVANRQKLRRDPYLPRSFPPRLHPRSPDSSVSAASISLLCRTFRALSSRLRCLLFFH